MPVRGSGFRAQQVATLSEMAHEMVTSEKLESLLDSLDGAAELNDTERKNISLTREDFIKQKKYPAAFVQKDE